MDKVFLSNVFELLKLSFGLSIESIREIEWLKEMEYDEMEQKNSEKNQQRVPVRNGKWIFCLFAFNSKADSITRYNFHQVRSSFYIAYTFHGVIGCTSKIHE